MTWLLHFLIALLFTAGPHQQPTPAVIDQPIAVQPLARHATPSPAAIVNSSAVAAPSFIRTTNDASCPVAEATTIVQDGVTYPFCYEDYHGQQIQACTTYLPDGTWVVEAQPNPTGPECVTSAGPGYQGGVMPNAVTS